MNIHACQCFVYLSAIDFSVYAVLLTERVLHSPRVSTQHHLCNLNITQKIKNAAFTNFGTIAYKGNFIFPDCLTFSVWNVHKRETAFYRAQIKRL